MNREIVFDRVVAAIVRANEQIRPEMVRNDASLVSDLGMDSMRLAALFTEVKGQFGHVDMTGWYVSAARKGSDTVQGLVDYLVDHLGRTAKDRPTVKVAVSQ